MKVVGTDLGEQTLSVLVGSCTSPAPTFTVTVVDNVTVNLRAWIITKETEFPVTVDDVRQMVKDANDIYAQGGVTLNLIEPLLIFMVLFSFLEVEGGHCRPGTSPGSHAPLQLADLADTKNLVKLRQVPVISTFGALERKIFAFRDVVYRPVAHPVGVAVSADRLEGVFHLGRMPADVLQRHAYGHLAPPFAPNSRCSQLWNA